MHDGSASSTIGQASVFNKRVSGLGIGLFKVAEVDMDLSEVKYQLGSVINSSYLNSNIDSL